jgi:hypothetical protein
MRRSNLSICPFTYFISKTNQQSSMKFGIRMSTSAINILWWILVQSEVVQYNSYFTKLNYLYSEISPVLNQR